MTFLVNDPSYGETMCAGLARTSAHSNQTGSVETPEGLGRTSFGRINLVNYQINSCIAPAVHIICFHNVASLPERQGKATLFM